jgi:hypothetical protein
MHLLMLFSSQLKETYTIVATLMNQSGFSWDPDLGAGITPETQGVWVDYVVVC